MFPCMSCGEPIEKPSKCCCDPLKSMLSEVMLASPAMVGDRLKSMAGPGVSIGENMKLAGTSPFGTVKGDVL